MVSKKILPILLLGALLLFISARGFKEHTVKKNENLSGIAQTYSTSVSEIKRINDLMGDTIHPGQKLKIPGTRRSTYTVVKGDSLEKISHKTSTPIETIKSLNKIRNDIVILGQTLLIPREPFNGEIYTVQKNDTLSHIALLYGMDINTLKKINNLNTSFLKEGQKLTLRPEKQIAAIEIPDNDIKSYTVKKGDTLWSLSSQYNVSIDSIKTWNNIKGNALYPGDILKIHINSTITERVQKNPPTPLSYYNSIYPSGSLPFPTGPYFYFTPEKRTQPSLYYMEQGYRNPADNYRKARTLIEQFDKRIQNESPLGKELSGYTIVIDPGHGGDDPGCISESRDGNGNSVFITEDEYAYDIALRVYRLLKLHGAETGLTIISPNHTIRKTPDPSLTFVHEKNEVYNSAGLNRERRPEDFPIGSYSGLVKRKTVAKQLFQGVPQNKRIFISIHNDNSPIANDSLFILYDGINDSEMQSSKNFAESMKNSIGSGTFVRNQPLAVLKRNPAQHAILIEVRNLYHDNNAWAVRNDQFREDDALKIVSGIINFVK